MSTVPAGWYADPSGQPDLQRWWDGQAWTEHVHPTPPVAPVDVVGAAAVEPAAASVGTVGAVGVDTLEPRTAAVGVDTLDPANLEVAQTAVPATTWPVVGGSVVGDVAGARPTSSRGGTDPLAIVALVASLLWVFGLGAVAGIVCGALALKRGVAGTSRTLAIVGLVLGVLGLLPLALLALGIGAIAVPVVLGQGDVASRAQLESDLRNAAIEQETFFTGSGTYLTDAGDLQRAVAPGTMLSIVRADDVGFCLEASDGAILVSYDSSDPGVRDGPC